MERGEFFKIIHSKGFERVENNSIYGDRTFETTPKHDGWSDGYNIKYVLTFQSTAGISLILDKLSVGGFSGNQEINDRLFEGSIETEDEFNTVLKCIRFNEDIL